VVTMMIFPGGFIFLLGYTTMSHRSSLRRVISSLFLFLPMVSIMVVLRAALLIPSSGMDAPVVKNLLLLMIMLRYVSLLMIVWILLGTDFMWLR